MMLPPETQILSDLVVTSALMAVLWLVKRRTGKAGIVDAGWAAGIGVLGVFYAATSDLADRQLTQFKRRPENRGKTCREGWWHYSRHPDYFCEWLQWWSYVALAVGSSYGWLTLLAPAKILYFLLKVTGIPPTEAQALASRGDDHRQYQRTTSAFIPWFPKKGGAS